MPRPADAVAAVAGRARRRRPARDGASSSTAARPRGALAPGRAAGPARAALDSSGPLDADAVRRSSPVRRRRPPTRPRSSDALGESGGVPATVHRVAGRWARTSAPRRLGVLGRADRGRPAGLRAAEAALIGDVSDLELARERERRYAATRRIDGAGVADGSHGLPVQGPRGVRGRRRGHYFGRERLVAELIARFVGGSFLGLVGDSGSGKSSALRAGLLPALAGGVLPGSAAWPQVVMRPGEHPLAELRRALAGPAGDDAAGRRRRRPRSMPRSPASPPGSASCRRRPVRGGLQRDPRRGRAERLHRAADGRAAGPQGHRLDARRPLRPLRGLPGARAAPGHRPGPRRPAHGRRARRGHRAARPSGSGCASSRRSPRRSWPTRASSRASCPCSRRRCSSCGGRASGPPDARRVSRVRRSSRCDRSAGGIDVGRLDPHRQAVARAILLRLAGPGEGTGLVRRRVPLAELDADARPRR